MQEETGEWRYLVIDPAGIRSRDDASYSEGAKRRDCPRYREGTIVMVDRRRRSGWTQWLGLSSGDGWLFDVSPKDKTVRMIEVEVVDGSWQYEPTVRVPVLPLPSTRAAAYLTKTIAGLHLHPFDVVFIDQRVRPIQMKGSFLRLADGRGWAMDFADGRQLMRRAFAQNEPAPPREAGASEAAPGPSSELGEWDYVVVDSAGLSLRSGPEYSSAKVPSRLEEGMIATVVERRSGDGTTFLRLASPQGWAFDVQPGSHARLRMVQVNVERGSWHYVVVSPHGVALRSRCSYSDTSRVGAGPQKGAFLTVTERVKIGESTFLHIEGGWIFDYKQGKKVVDGPIAAITPPPGTTMQVEAEQAYEVRNVAGSGEFNAPGLRYRCSPCNTDMDATQHALWGSIVHGTTVTEDWLKVGDRFLPLRVNGSQVLRKVDEAGVRLSREPTDAPWAASKLFMLDRAQLQVTLMCQLEGTRWARVASAGGNMEGWMHQRLLVDPRGAAIECPAQNIGGVGRAFAAPAGSAWPR